MEFFRDKEIRIPFKSSIGFAILVVYSIWFSNHYKSLFDYYWNEFFFWERDYIGMQLVLENLWNQGSFKSFLYADGKSYLSHHFTPSLFLLSPFEGLIQGRGSYAFGLLIYYLLGIILWYGILWKTNPIFSIFFVLGNLYLYRLGTSFHFEILVIPLSAIFYWSWFVQNRTDWILRFISLILFLGIKEDIGLYLLLFASTLLFFREGETKKLRLISSVTILYLVYIALFQFAHFDQSLYTVWWEELKKNSGGFNELSQGKRFWNFVQVFFGIGIAVAGRLGPIFAVGVLMVLQITSQRPWYNEVYSYYSYTLLPFVFWAMALSRWQNRFYLLLLLLLFLIRGSWDKSFPIPLQKSPITNLSELPLGKDKRIFTQTNLAFLVPKGNVLLPLDSLNCDTSPTYILVSKEIPAQGFQTQEKIHSHLLNVTLGKKYSYSVKGKEIELWECLGDQINKQAAHPKNP